MKKYKLELDDSSLASIISLWFKDNDINDPNIFRKNKVAQTLRENLKSKNRWKNLPRGKPYTGPPEKDPF